MNLRISIIVFLLFIFFSGRTSAQDYDIISLSAGWYDFLQKKDEALEIRAELRSSFEIWNLKPFYGLMSTSDGALTIYLGIYTDIQLSKNIFLTPSFAPCIHKDGIRGKKLLSQIEFKTQLELTYLLENNFRIGFNLFHISNGGIQIYNPGVESFSLVFIFPLK